MYVNINTQKTTKVLDFYFTKPFSRTCEYVIIIPRKIYCTFIGNSYHGYGSQY